jgi:hypothetical protein
MSEKKRRARLTLTERLSEIDASIARLEALLEQRRAARAALIHEHEDKARALLDEIKGAAR